MCRVVIFTKKWSSWPGFAGSTWVPIQYMAGFERLGVEAVWVDWLPSVDPQKHVHSLPYLMRRFDETASDFGFADRYCVVYGGGRSHFGMGGEELQQRIAEAELLLGLSSKGIPKGTSLRQIPRRAYIDVDPGFTQIWAEQVNMGLADYNLFFTVGLNVGGPGFDIPTPGITWLTMLPPVVLDLWPVVGDQPCDRFSTVGDWWGKQKAKYRGRYYGGKRGEFLQLLDLPELTGQSFELALTITPQDYKEIGRLHGARWRILDPYLYAGDPHSYREFIQFSRAEFSVAKSGYVMSNSGWVSDRSVCYLASGRPALVQSTGFEPYLPTGTGLVTFRDLDEAVAGVNSINEDYEGHRRAARSLAEEYFDSDVVLTTLLERAGL